MTAVLFALLSAAANAVNMVTQHLASSSAPTHPSWWRLALSIVRHPLWLIGAAAAAAAFVFHALALHEGALSVVQPLLVTELVFALVFRRFWFHQTIPRSGWIGAVLTGAGLTVFFVVAAPSGGHEFPTPAEWISAVSVMGFLAGVLTLLSTWGSPTRRSAGYGVAAGILFALLATFLKAATDVLTTSGLLAVLSSWTLYAIIASGVAGALAMQASMHVGPLSVSQPVMVATDPIISVALAGWLYDEQIAHAPVDIVLVTVSFVVVGWGIALMSRSADSRSPSSPIPDRP